MPGAVSSAGSASTAAAQVPSSLQNPEAQSESCAQAGASDPPAHPMLQSNTNVTPHGVFIRRTLRPRGKACQSRFCTATINVLAVQHRTHYGRPVAPPVVIKKYGNRRLYDTGDSRYVTLDELAVKIRTGADLRIVDAQTGEDLTQATLTQLVLETGNAAKFLPVQLLTQMIRLSDDSLAEFFSRYVTTALEVYLQARRGVASLAQYNPLSGTELFRPGAATDALARMWMASPFVGGYAQQPQPGAYPPGYPTGSPYVVAPPPPEGDAPPVRDAAPAISPPTDDMAAMRRELDELKQAILASRPAATGKPKKKKS